MGLEDVRLLRRDNMILLAAAMVAVTLAAPTPPGGILTLSEGETERDAILLECCDLPDKQLVLTEADLDGIVSRFVPDVPIKLQHVDSPLDPFGAVQRIWREGRQLLGRIAFPPAIAALVRERGASALSCGLTRVPYSLAEVSLVVKGRLASAVLLSDSDQAELIRLRSESLALRMEVDRQLVDAQIVAFKLSGKIIPATEAAARVLLSAGAGAVITLSGGGTQSAPVAFAAYLAAQPSLVTLGELKALQLAQTVDATSQAGLYGSATGNGAEEGVTLDDDQRAFLSKSMGLDPDKVAATMTADKKTEAKKAATSHSHQTSSSTHGASGAGHHGTSPMGSHPREGHRV